MNYHFQGGPDKLLLLMDSREVNGAQVSGGWNEIPAWINNYIHYKVWDEITYPFPNFNSIAVEVGNG